MAQPIPSVRQMFEEMARMVDEPREQDKNFECVYRFNIKPSTSWILEVYPEPVATAFAVSSWGKVYEVGINEELPPDKKPDCTLTYESGEVFQLLAAKKLSPHKAFLRRKLLIQGNMAKMRFLRQLMERGHQEAAQKQRQRSVSYSICSSSSAAPIAVPWIPETVPRRNWVPDGLSHQCHVCLSAFSFTLRRHHCRFCGGVVCDGCSGRRFWLGGRRACRPCSQRAEAQKKLAPTAEPAPTFLSADGSEMVAVPTALGAVEEGLSPSADLEDVGVLKERVMELEEKVDTFEKDAYSAKAEVLIMAVKLVHFCLVWGIYLLGLLGGHLVAKAGAPVLGRGLCRWLGTSAEEAAGSTPVGTEGEMPPGWWQDEGLGCCVGPAAYAGVGEGSVEQLWRLYSGTSLAESLESGGPLYWVVYVYLVVLGVFYLRVVAQGLLPRRLKTLMLAGVVITWMKTTKQRAKKLGPARAEELWAHTQKLMGPFTYQAILEIKGLFVKAGQYLSSRADVMPKAFVEELSKLQDAVPPSPGDHVRHIVEGQLGGSVRDLFRSFTDHALASASIAQVHEAELFDGTKVVVKVQHDNVRQLMMEDTGNIWRIVRFVAFFEPEYDFRPIMDEWSKEVTKELDFANEAANLERVYGAMARSGLNVKIPRLLPEFTRPQVLVMTFCEGWKVTDKGMLDKLDGEEREKLMKAICEAFAYQIYMDGLFNGDPHPGNILVQSEEGGGGWVTGTKPVLLDWGLAKTLPDHLRLAFARFIYAAQEMDFIQMLISFEDMGIKLNRFDPAEDMNNIRFMFRDNAPPEEAKLKHRKHFKGWKKRRDKQKADTGRRNPVDAYPGDLLFFIRANELLHGLGSRLRVRTPYLSIMAPFARTALLEACPPDQRARCPIWPSPVLSPLEAKVRGLLTELIDKDLVTGAQVCVYGRGGARLVDTCCGRQGPVDARPVTPRTLFPAMSISKALLSTALHAMVDQGALRYDDLVSSVWPEFGRNGKEECTIRHVLTHSTGLQHVLPENPTFDALCDWKGCQKLLEEAKPIWKPGARCSYHYFTYGWLVGSIIEKAWERTASPAGPRTCGEIVHQEVLAPLGLHQDIVLGELSRWKVQEDRLATLESDVAKRFAASMGDQAPDEEDEEEEDSANMGMAGLQFLAAGVKEEDEEEGKALEELARKLSGREYLLDPRIFNYKQLRDACLPAANGHATAAALASLFSTFLPGGSTGAGGSSTSSVLSQPRVEEMSRLQAQDQSAYNQLFGMSHGMRYGLGYQLFGFRDPVPTPTPTSSHTAPTFNKTSASAGPVKSVPRFTAFGHVGAGGSVVMCDPTTGFVFAMTLNKIVEGREATRQVLQLVCEELGVGMPVAFVE